MVTRRFLGLASGLLLASWCTGCTPQGDAQDSLWRVYSDTLAQAKYVDLTHSIAPEMPVWAGFGPSRFLPSQSRESGKPFTYAGDGFEANQYHLATDQLGTQLDPPAHWDPAFASIDEIPATYAIRPLVVISIVHQVKKDPGYALRVADVLEWERKNGRIPQGSVVFVRSDWSLAWPNPELATQKVFPGVSLDALNFLHLQRRILFHGHEPLDTDCTPTLEGESWLMHHGYAQAEGVTNLGFVPEKGALVAIGYAKFQGGLGGYARYIAICPANWKYGVKVGQRPEAPLARFERPLHWDAAKGMRVR